LHWDPAESGRSLWWFHDSASWFEEVSDDQGTFILEHTPDRKNGVRRDIEGIGPDFCLLGIGSDGRFLGFSGESEGPTDSVYLIDTEIRSASASARKHKVSLPMTVSGYWMLLSNKGDRLLWWLRHARVDPFTLCLHRLMPQIRVRYTESIGLWVSRTDGSEIKEVGSKPKLPDVHWDKDVRNFNWLPGDKRISFTYGDALYTSAVP
jgi:hypothetical protein